MLRILFEVQGRILVKNDLGFLRQVCYIFVVLFAIFEQASGCFNKTFLSNVCTEFGRPRRNFGQLLASVSCH